MRGILLATYRAPPVFNELTLWTHPGDGKRRGNRLSGGKGGEIINRGGC